MKRVHTWGIGLALTMAAGLVIFAGCNKDNTVGPGPGGNGSENLTTLNGGLTSSDELPGFGNATLLGSVAAQSPQADIMSQDPTVQDVEAGRIIGARVYAVTILWGVLQAPDAIDADGSNSAGVQYDWTGSLAVDHGILLLKSVISFEVNDHMGIRSALLPKDLDWTSHTSTGFDGIRLLVYEPTRTGGQGAPLLTVNTPTYQGTISLGQLAPMDTLITADAHGNKVFITSFLTSPGSNARGYLQGHWTRMAAGDSLAHFTGIWVSPRADVKGFIRGHYGIDIHGHRHFYGKYVDLSGTFQGILRGTWGVARPDPESNGAEIGWYVGRWVNANGVEAGQIRGNWGTAGSTRGLFLGEWCSACGFGATDL